MLSTMIPLGLAVYSLLSNTMSSHKIRQAYAVSDLNCLFWQSWVIWNHRLQQMLNPPQLLLGLHRERFDDAIGIALLTDVVP